MLKCVAAMWEARKSMKTKAAPPPPSEEIGLQFGAMIRGLAHAFNAWYFACVVQDIENGANELSSQGMLNWQHAVNANLSAYMGLAEPLPDDFFMIVVENRGVDLICNKKYRKLFKDVNHPYHIAHAVGHHAWRTMEEMTGEQRQNPLEELVGAILQHGEVQHIMPDRGEPDLTSGAGKLH